MSRRRSLVSELSLVASLSALYIAFRIVPTFPMIGIPGTFKAGDFVAPLYGMILGPILGPVAVTTGTIIGFFTGAPPQLLGLDFLPGACSAALVGSVTRSKWAQSIILNLTVIVIFVLLPFAVFFIPVGNALVPYVWLHLVGLALLISPLSKKASLEITRDWRGSVEKMRASEERLSHSFGQHFRAFFVLAFSATLAQHLTGGILTQLVVGIYFNRLPTHYQTWEGFWTTIFWIYPVERTVIALASALIGSASILALKISRLSERLPSV